MKIIVESINFDNEELSYLDSEGADIEYGGLAVVSYIAQTSKVNKLRGEIAIKKNAYDDMKLSDVEEEIKKEL